MFYTGKDFEGAKEYKTLEGAKKAADKNGLYVFNEDAKKIYPEGTEDVEEQEATGPETGEVEVRGKIRRVFNGKLRLRREASFSDKAICGVTKFTIKNVVKKITVPEGVLYQTEDGYFVSGDPALVEFTAEE